MTDRPSPLVLASFAASVLIAGGNVVAVRFSNAELAPFWGAGLRFVLAAPLFLVLMVAMRLPSPAPGAARRGVAVYGVFAFFLAYAVGYYALTVIPAGLASVLMALVPLLTIILATLHRLEPFRIRGLVGALVCLAGVALIFRAQIDAVRSVPHLMAGLVFVALVAETTILVKRYPRVHPVTANAGGMALGAALLLTLALVAGEPIALPQRSTTWWTLAYLVLVGSCGLFFLFRYVVDRWTASAVNYQFVLMPLVTIPLGAALAAERVTWDFALGALVVVAGVYVGALSGRSAPARPVPRA